MESSAAERRRRENAEIAERLRREEEDKAERLRREEEEKMTNTCHYKEYVTRHYHVTSSIPTHVRYDGVHVSDKDMFRQRIVSLWLSDVTGKVQCLLTLYYLPFIKCCRPSPRCLFIHARCLHCRPSLLTPPAPCTCMCRTELCCLRLQMSSWYFPALFAADDAHLTLPTVFESWFLRRLLASNAFQSNPTFVSILAVFFIYFIMPFPSISFNSFLSSINFRPLGELEVTSASPSFVASAFTIHLVLSNFQKFLENPEFGICIPSGDRFLSQVRSEECVLRDAV